MWRKYPSEKKRDRAQIAQNKEKKCLPGPHFCFFLKSSMEIA